MRRALPSMHALKAFEAAGRLGSFSLAATELFVTQGAISRQIRGLEDYLGTSLFLRLTRRVKLTDAGEIYLKEIQTALEHVERATTHINNRKKTHSLLTISVLPSIASFWLMPRLFNFTQLYPHIETHVQTSIQPVNLQENEAGIAIRVGSLPGRRYSTRQPRIDLEMTANWKGIHAEQLFEDRLVPVLSPRLMDTAAPIQEPAHLLRYPLIHTASRARAWYDWLSFHDLNEPATDKKLEYGHFFMAIEAARKGQGVALVPEILLANLHDENLAMPLAPSVTSAGAYYLLVRQEQLDETHCAAFIHWIKAQANLLNQKITS